MIIILLAFIPTVDNYIRPKRYKVGMLDYDSCKNNANNCIPCKRYPINSLDTDYRCKNDNALTKKCATNVFNESQ